MKRVAVVAVLLLGTCLVPWRVKTILPPRLEIAVAHAQIDTSKTLGSASNKELLGELIRRLADGHPNDRPSGWDGTMTTAKVDSFLKAYGYKAGLTDGSGGLRAATATEFGDDLWGYWWSNIYKSYVKNHRTTQTENDSL